MIFQQTPLQGNYLIDLELIDDERGFFARYYCENEFRSHGLNFQWVQINNSMSKVIGTLRGLHFQRPPHAEVKLVRCIKGRFGMLWWICGRILKLLGNGLVQNCLKKTGQ